MELYGHFSYNGRSSREFGLMIANAETKRNTKLSGEIESSVVFGKKAIRNYFACDDYSDSPLSIDVEILCDEDQILNVPTQREIKKWLFYMQGYGKLFIDLEDDPYGENYELVDGQQKRIYLNCRFTNPERVEGNGGICGYRATLEADSPLAWQEKVDATITLTGGTNANAVSTLSIDTDLRDYTYPKVTITTGESGGDIIIANNTDDATRLTKFVGVSANTQIVMNNEIGYVSGQNYSKFAIKNFVRLLDGDNAISTVGDIVSIKFEWQNRRYL